jgi:integrase
MPISTLCQTTLQTLPFGGTNPQAQCIYWDAALPAFGLRVYPSGRRTFVCAYREGGRKRLVRVGRADVFTLTEARERARSVLKAHASRIAPLAPPRQQFAPSPTVTQAPAAIPGSWTFAELARAFLEQHAKVKRLSWKSDESCLRRHLLPHLQRRVITSIVSADIERIHTWLGRRFPYAANTLLDLVRKMFNWACITGFLPRDHRNPAEGIVQFPERARKRFITAAEMPQFLCALEAEDNEYARHALWLLLLLGVRGKEILKARWTDIDWQHGTLAIGLTKNGEPVLVTLSEAALARLRLIPQMPGNPYLICGRKPGRPLHALGVVLRRVVARAGLTNLRVHDLRRTVGSWLAHAGASLHLIGDVLNHLDLKTTLGYAYFQTEHRRAALDGHAEKVLSFAQAPLRVGAPPTELSAQNLLATAVPRTSHRHYFRRSSLYELVWSAPVTEISEQLGVSDVALAKLCRRAAVPRPGRGYWARVEAGQRVARTPLPPPPEHVPDLLRIRGRKAIVMARTSAAA